MTPRSGAGAKPKTGVFGAQSGRSPRGLTPRSRRRPATAATAWPLQAQFGIVLPRPSGVCLHGRLSSNVRHQRRPSHSLRQQAAAGVPCRPWREQARSGSLRLERTRATKRGLRYCLKPTSCRLVQSKSRRQQSVAKTGNVWHTETLPLFRERGHRAQRPTQPTQPCS